MDSLKRRFLSSGTTRFHAVMEVVARLLVAVLLIYLPPVAAKDARPEVYKPGDLVKVTEARTVTLEETLPLLIKSTSWATVDVEEGLLPGLYVSRYENEKGTFFFGPGRSTYRGNAGKGKYYISQGGFWVPKDAEGEPRLFEVSSDQVVVRSSIPKAAIETTAGVRSTASVPGQQTSNLAQGIGAGLGGAIVSVLIAKGNGKFVLYPPVDDTVFVSRLKARIDTMAQPVAASSSEGEDTKK